MGIALQSEVFEFVPAWWALRTYNSCPEPALVAINSGDSLPIQVVGKFSRFERLLPSTSPGVHAECLADGSKRPRTRSITADASSLSPNVAHPTLCSRQ